MRYHQQSHQPFYWHHIGSKLPVNDPVQSAATAGSLSKGEQEGLDAALRILGYGTAPKPLTQLGWELQLRQLLRQATEPHDALAQAHLPSEVTEPYWWTGLGRERSELAALARFAQRVDYATLHLCVAFQKAGIRDFEPPAPRKFLRPTSGIDAWYTAIVNAAFHRYDTLRKALLHRWTPSAEAMPSALYTLLILSDLTPAGSKLHSHFTTDPSRALRELAQQLDIVAEQLTAAIQLPDGVGSGAAGDQSSEDAARLDDVQAGILENAGEPLSLTGAAKRLGVTRQALHKRIQSGSALGLMRGAELVVPSAQIIEREGKPAVVSGLSSVISLFDEAGAGRWSALQFLTEVDPLLKAVPLEVLKRGDISGVVSAARGYLSLDEA